MARYIGQRFLAAVPVLLGILFITFAMARLLPGEDRWASDVPDGR